MRAKSNALKPVLLAMAFRISMWWRARVQHAVMNTRILPSSYLTLMVFCFAVRTQFLTSSITVARATAASMAGCSIYLE